MSSVQCGVIMLWSECECFCVCRRRSRTWYVYWWSRTSMQKHDLRLSKQRFVSLHTAKDMSLQT